jgi:hypothetical protein
MEYKHLLLVSFDFNSNEVTDWHRVSAFFEKAKDIGDFYHALEHMFFLKTDKTAYEVYNELEEFCYDKVKGEYEETVRFIFVTELDKEIVSKKMCNGLMGSTTWKWLKAEL